MLSLFPSLLVYERMAPFILRITLAAVFLFWAYGKIKKRKDGKVMTLGVIELITGILFVMGFYTQLASLLAVIILIMGLSVKARTKSLFTDGVNYYFILLVIAISLLLTGPGAFAFDLSL